MTSNGRNKQSENLNVEDYLLYLLARASAVTSRQFHAVVKQHGLGVPEWRVLFSINDRPRNVGELAEMTLLEQSTLSKLIDRMTKKGWVKRLRPNSNDVKGDGRIVLVTITENGRNTVTKLQIEALRHEKTVLAGYSKSEARQLKTMLKELIDRSLAQQ